MQSTAPFPVEQRYLSAAMTAFQYILEEVLTDDSKWIQHEPRKAGACCLLTALNAIPTTNKVRNMCYHLIQEEIGGLFLSDYNDAPGRSFEDIRGMLVRCRARIYKELQG